MAALCCSFEVMKHGYASSLAQYIYMWMFLKCLEANEMWFGHPRIKVQKDFEANYLPAIA